MLKIIFCQHVLRLGVTFLYSESKKKVCALTYDRQNAETMKHWRVTLNAFRLRLRLTHCFDLHDTAQYNGKCHNNREVLRKISTCRLLSRG